MTATTSHPTEYRERLRAAFARLKGHSISPAMVQRRCNFSDQTWSQINYSTRGITLIETLIFAESLLSDASYLATGDQTHRQNLSPNEFQALADSRYCSAPTHSFGPIVAQQLDSRVSGAYSSFFDEFEKVPAILYDAVLRALSTGNREVDAFMVHPPRQNPSDLDPSISAILAKRSGKATAKLMDIVTARSAHFKPFDNLTIIASANSRPTTSRIEF